MLVSYTPNDLMKIVLLKYQVVKNTYILHGYNCDPQSQLQPHLSTFSAI